MSKYMPRRVFRSSCFLLASCYQDQEKFENLLAGIQKNYAATYPGDDFVPDLCEGVAKLREMLEKDRIVQSEEDKQLLFYSYYQISRDIEPDGTKHKKFLGFFGGTLFSGSHPNPANRVHDLVMEFAGYTLHYTFTVLSEARRLARQRSSSEP
jgi:hypothetical protein